MRLITALASQLWFDGNIYDCPVQDAAFPGMKNVDLPRFAVSFNLTYVFFSVWCFLFFVSQTLAFSLDRQTLDTGKGSVTIELFKDTAPNVVDQFMKFW